MTRRRADVLLAERGLFESRERAKAAIIAGQVRIGDRVVFKAGEQLAEDTEFQISEVDRFVSRGGTKLSGALDSFGIDPTGMRAIDVGASTGGFTDCLLQRGAVSVAAVDVGYGQLAWQLRQDPRVTTFERTNIRSADPAELGAPFDIAVVDVSFIGLSKILPQLIDLLNENGLLVALVKPQFEAGKGRVGKKGVVRDASTHIDVLETVVSQVRAEGLFVHGLAWSPITGPEGNIEFWLWAKSFGPGATIDPTAVVHAARESLGV
ncbi:MAG: TlyA family RNA methyltransferase [Coriobacteriia bacterium]|nr:TlyA family RNA methyltransferase [Coriobacteriia bacterium]